MANREKKISLSGKKSSSPIPLSPTKESNEEVTTSAMTTTTSPTTITAESESTSTLSSALSTAATSSSSATISSEDNEAPKLTPIKNAKVSRKIKRSISKKILNNQNTSFSPTTGKPRGRPKKIRPLEETNLAITVASSAATTTPPSSPKVKKVRVKNGVRKNLLKKIKQEDDGPPILEPIFPVETKIEPKKIKKRTKKESAEDTPETKKPRTKKIKLDEDTETLEDVMNDLKTLIKVEDIKEEPCLNEVIVTKKKCGRKPKTDSLQKKKLLKKQAVDAIDNSKLIDGLDLNVNKVKKKAKRVRRHSIEKILLEKNDNKVPNIFSNLPRSISPKGKRGRKPRKSIEVLTRKKRSPYTRSDSPARILRNGKHRKLKDIGLLEGVDILRRRRRLCSDYSGSEVSISKLSGYESDSSFSDLASITGNVDPNERESDTKIEIKKEIDICNAEQQDQEEKVSLKIKKSPSLEANTNGSLDDQYMDTNSNLCADSNICPDNANSNEDSASICGDSTNVYEDNVNQDENQLTVETNLLQDISETENLDATNLPTNTSDQLADDTDLIGNLSDDGSLNTKVINPLYNAALYNDSKVPEKSIILDSMKHKFNENITDQIKDEESTEDEQLLDELSPLKLYSSTVLEDEEGSVNDLDEKIEENRDVVDEEEDEEEHDTSSEHIEDKMDEEIQVHKETIHEDEITSEESQEESMQIDSEEINDGITVKQLEEPEPDKVDIAVVETENIDSKKSDVDYNLQETSEFNDSENPQQEDLIVKEHILQALGLQSLRAAEEAKQKQKEKVLSKGDNYTGTLKTVIKLPKFDKKKGRSGVKMTLHKMKKTAVASTSKEDDLRGEDDYKIMKENGSNWKSGGQSSDTAGAARKSHYSNRSNMDGSSEHTSDGDTNGGEEIPGKALVIPEKASSFSIHPDRLCKDECSYCFGKFGLFDTPCHIAQMKSVERQDKILATEKHLMRDSCLCDACFRHVDRKSNIPSYANKSYKRNTLVAPGPKQNHCHVLSCNNIASNILRRKWIIKMKKNINEVVNIDLDNPGLHSIPICDEHYAALEHLMVCAMCKRTLATNHIHHLGIEMNELNNILDNMGIPIKLNDKPVVCKLCRYFANILLKMPDERPENSTEFIKEYKKRLLHFHNIELMDEAEAKEPIPVPTKDKEPMKKKKKKNIQPENNFQYESENASDQTLVPSTDSRPESPSDYVVDYQTLIPNIALECGNDSMDMIKKDYPKKIYTPTILKKVNKPESVKEAVEISKSLKVKNTNSNIKSDMAVQRLGSNPSISVRQLFPGEEELSIQSNIDFSNIKERTPEGWEKCTSTIQFDPETKLLWQELQKPYGNQSSFLRHLILLEKYFRNGDLALSSNASNNSINYSESVQNRLKAYDNIPSNAGPTQPLTMLPFNKIKKSTSGIITSKDYPQGNVSKPTQIAVAQINNTSILSTSTTTSTTAAIGAAISKPKPAGLPPGLISLQPGTNKPIAPLQKIQPQSHKIKFPITKNWRPNLIPIDPNKKTDKKSGLVQVISGGKAYHITIEDYKKMCAIKRTFDLRQKRLLEPNQRTNQYNNNAQSVLKTIVPKKGLTITKTTSMVTNTTTTTTPQQHQSFNTCKIDNSLNSSSISNNDDFENSLEKLDKQVEKLDSKSNDKSLMILPKIPKSLTVIPQSVTRKSTTRPTTPILQITPKPKPSTSKS